MIVIVCTEDRGGMLFNNRRVSKDRTVIQKILELSEGKKLWIHPFSEKLFEQEHPENCCVDENFLEKAGEGDICFVENQSLKGSGTDGKNGGRGICRIFSRKDHTVTVQEERPCMRKNC